MGINSPRQTIRRPKHIENPKDVQYILSLTEEQAAEKDTIMELFADFGDGPRFNTYDTIENLKLKYDFVISVPITVPITVSSFSAAFRRL